MKAVVFDSFGGPEVLHVADRPDPVAGPGEVVVAVAASTVNPTDMMMRSGAQAAMMKDLAPPFITGMEFSGRILAAGPGVDPGMDLAPGTPVIGVLNPRTPRGGAYAERIAVSARSVAVLDEGTDLIGAATVPMNALTASMALDLLNLAPGAPLMVTGGAGMLGGYAIALAKARGLVVLANASTADVDLLRGFGADHIVPRDAGLHDAVRALFPEGVAGLIDGALIGNQVASLVRDGGGAVALRSSYKIDDPRLRTHTVSVVAGVEDSATLARIGRMVCDGTLPPRVAKGGVFGFRDAARAHEMAEAGGFRGRVVITF